MVSARPDRRLAGAGSPTASADDSPQSPESTMQTVDHDARTLPTILIHSSGRQTG